MEHDIVLEEIKRRYRIENAKIRLAFKGNALSRFLTGVSLKLHLNSKYEKYCYAICNYGKINELMKQKYDLEKEPLTIDMIEKEPLRNLKRGPKVFKYGR